MVSGAKIFTEVSRHDIISTVNFPYFIYTCNQSYKINKTNMLATRINSIESSAEDMGLKILPEPKNGLNMLQKNYQALPFQDRLVMHLTLHELAY